MLNQACLVTRDLIKDPSVLAFFCHTEAGFSAAPSEAALDQGGFGNLTMVHLGWVVNTPLGFPEMAALPEGFAMDLVDRVWWVRYFHDDDEVAENEPEEGAFLAPPLGHPLLELNDTQLVWVFEKKNLLDSGAAGQGELVTITLDEGAPCLPFWCDAAGAEVFRDHVSKPYDLIQMPFVSVKEKARKVGLTFLAPDFLSMPYDYALLVDP